MVPKLGLGSRSGLAAAVAVVFTVGSSTINRLLTELARAVLGILARGRGILVTTEFVNMWHFVYYVALCF